MEASDDDGPSKPAKKQKTGEPAVDKVCARLHGHFWVWDAIVGGHKLIEYRDQAVWGKRYIADPIPYTHLKLWRAYTSTYALVKIGRMRTHEIGHSTSFQAGPYNNNPALVMPFPGVRSIICIPLLHVVHVGVNKKK